MSFTYNLATNIGKVRRTIPDKEETDAIWSDEEITSFLDDENNDWRRASALALEIMASDELLVLKTIRIHNIETNSDRMASALMKRAQSLRQLAKEADADTDASSFEIIEMVTDDNQYQNKVLNAALRGTL
jgi:hypothetical protein